MKCHRLTCAFVLFLPVCVASAGVKAATAPRFREIVVVAPKVEAIAGGDQRIADFDRDGRPDALLSYRNSHIALHVVGASPVGTWVTKQTVLFPTNPGAPDNTSVAVSTGAEPSVVATHHGELLVFGGWPLQLIRSFEVIPPGTGGFLSAVTIGDVDRDGYEEIISATNHTAPSKASIYVHDLNTGAFRWMLAASDDPINSVALAQLDADPALEIVLGSRDLIVVDGATKALEARLEQLSPRSLATIEFNGTPRAILTGAPTSIYASLPLIPAWSSSTFGIGASAADTDGDGHDDVVERSSPGIMITQTATHATVWRGRGYVAQVAIADFLGNGSPISVNGLSSTEFDPSSLDVVDLASNSILYSEPPALPGIYVAEFLERGVGVPPAIALASANRFNRGRAGAIRSIDSLTGEKLWESAEFPPGHPLWSFIIQKIFTMRSADGATLILAAGRHGARAAVFALDATDGTYLWTASVSNEDTWTNAAILLDVDDDGAPESILVCSSDSRLRELRLEDRVVVWTSDPLDNQESCQDLIVSRHVDRTDIIVALPHKLISFDAATKVLLEEVGIAQSFGAARIDAGESDAEIAVFMDDAIRFHNARDLAQLRTVVVPGIDFITAVSQPPERSIHELIVSNGNALRVVDGVDGSIAARTHAYGDSVALGGPIPVHPLAQDRFLVAAAAGSGVVSLELTILEDGVFSNGFD